MCGRVVSRRWVKDGFVAATAVFGLDNGIVPFKDKPLRPILIPSLHVILADTLEVVEDVGYFVSADSVDAEHERVHLRSDQSSTLSVPTERRSMPAEFGREWGHVPRGVAKFKKESWLDEGSIRLHRARHWQRFKNAVVA